LFHPIVTKKAEAGPTTEGNTSRFAGVQLLRACGYEVELVDAGCCGMGGTFGYEAEHYELSQRVGELKLFPAIRSSGDVLIAATGGACRLQITQGTGKRRAPAVLAARALGIMRG